MNAVACLDFASNQSVLFFLTVIFHTATTADLVEVAFYKCLCVFFWLLIAFCWTVFQILKCRFVELYFCDIFDVIW